MKKIFLLNLLSAGLLVGVVNACEPPDTRGALAQLGQGAGFDFGDCPQQPGQGAEPVPQELMPCDWENDGACWPGGVPFFPGEGYCDETGPQYCPESLGGHICAPLCVVAMPLYTGPIVYENYRGKAEVLPTLRQVSLAQPSAKELVAGYLLKNNAEAKARLLADKNITVVSDGKSVFLTVAGKTIKINDPELATRVYAVIYPALTGARL